MGHWNHRVVRRVFPELPGAPVMYGIHEAFCDAKGLVWAITEDPTRVITDGEDGDPVVSLRQNLERMMRALERPVLDYDKIPEADADTPNWTEALDDLDDLDDGDPDDTIFPKEDDSAHDDVGPR